MSYLCDMANLFRMRIDISGAGVVGASVMTLYSGSSSAGLPAAAYTWLNASKANFPPNVTFTVPNGGDILLDTTGVLTGAWTDTGGGTVTGTGTGGFAIGVGARVVWGTSGIVNGRRVKGSTFLVPLMSGSFETDGRLRAATIAALNTPLQAFHTSMGTNQVIWSRPVPGRSGSSSTVTSATIPVNPATLRSRRT